MAAAPLIVSTLIPSGALHFAAVQQSATVQDIIDALSPLEDVRDDVLGDLEDGGWAVQTIRRPRPGKPWDEEELKQLGNGKHALYPSSWPNSVLVAALLTPSDPIAPLLPAVEPAPLQRHFSAFPLTSHLHTPSIRLVSLHPSLTLNLSFLRVPEIDDGFTMQWYLVRSTTVEEVIEGVAEEMGLTKVITGPGGGTVDYALEEAWISSTGEEGER